jgi:hypothetical protein
MAALSVRVLYWTNKCECAKMENRHFYSEPCIWKASQAFEDSPVQYLSPEKTSNSHNGAQGSRTHELVTKKPATLCQVSQEVHFIHDALRTRPRNSSTPPIKIRMDVSPSEKPVLSETKISH